MNPKDVATAAAAAFGTIPGIKSALEHDDDELAGVPAITLSLSGTAADDRWTGPSEEMTWTWVVRLYLPFGGNIVGSDVAATDELQYDLIPRLYKKIRDDRSLGGACVKAMLDDPGEEPDRDEEQGIAIKHLRLRAVTEEV